MSQEKDKIISEDYVKHEVAKISQEEVDSVVKNQEEITQKMKSSSLLEKYSALGKVLFNMLKDYRTGIYTNVPWFTIAAIAFGFLYILNPLDIVPDFIPGIGYIDDLAVLTFGLRFIESDLHNYLDWKIEEEA